MWARGISGFLEAAVTDSDQCKGDDESCDDNSGGYEGDGVVKFMFVGVGEGQIIDVGAVTGVKSENFDEFHELIIACGGGWWQVFKVLAGFWLNLAVFRCFLGFLADFLKFDVSLVFFPF